MTTLPLVSLQRIPDRNYDTSITLSVNTFVKCNAMIPGRYATDRDRVELDR